eukprot:g43101.t1
MSCHVHVIPYHVHAMPISCHARLITNVPPENWRPSQQRGSMVVFLERPMSVAHKSRNSVNFPLREMLTTLSLHIMGSIRSQTATTTYLQKSCGVLLRRTDIYGANGCKRFALYFK